MRHMEGLVSFALPVLEVIDSSICRLTGRRQLPPFALRISTGSPLHMIGGGTWMRMGAQMVEEVKAFCGLLPTHHVVEIGCSCGIAAVHLKSYLTSGVYTGVDILPESIAWCREHLGNERFRFVHLDVSHDLYRPAGAADAEHVRLPLGDNSADAVFLVSVFTHMLPNTIQHYLNEIGRILKPQGRCLATMLTKDRYVPGRAVFSLRYQHNDECLCWDAESPTKAVAVSSASISRMAENSGLNVYQMSPGQWDGQTRSAYLHDMYVFKKE